MSATSYPPYDNDDEFRKTGGQEGPGRDGSGSDEPPIEAWLADAGPGGAGQAGAQAAEPSEIVEATLVAGQGPGDGDRSTGSAAPRRRRVKLPLILFAVTCLSTFWAGTTWWTPTYYLGMAWEAGSFMPLRQAIVAHWQDGLIYMACLLAILFFHEMGHFLATLRYRIPASLPYFLPLPITPIGTLGAVIGMDGLRADRKEMFDIGLAGPLAGLVVALPVMWIGIHKLDLTQAAHGGIAFDLPLLVKLMLQSVQPPGYQPGSEVWISQLNPYFMAGWVGLLITGLNMLPVSQLDGGHVIYTLFKKRAHWIARGFMLLAIAYILWAGAYIWTLMLILVMLIGTDHPPTRNDNMPIGWFRVALGLASLLIPILCFPPQGLKVAM